MQDIAAVDGDGKAAALGMVFGKPSFDFLSGVQPQGDLVFAAEVSGINHGAGKTGRVEADLFRAEGGVTAGGGTEFLR